MRSLAPFALPLLPLAASSLLTKLSTMNRDTPPLPGLAAPYDLLASVLQDGTHEWRAELPDDVPVAAVVWQPHPGMHSIGGIMLHIMAIEVIWFERFVLRLPLSQEERELFMLAETDVDEWRWPTPPLQPLAWYFELHDRIRARMIEGFKNWPAGETHIEDGDEYLTPRWVLGHVIQHEAYHGGQAVLLYRLWQLQNPSG